MSFRIAFMHGFVKRFPKIENILKHVVQIGAAKANNPFQFAPDLIPCFFRSSLTQRPDVNKTFVTHVDNSWPLGHLPCVDPRSGSLFGTT